MFNMNTGFGYIGAFASGEGEHRKFKNCKVLSMNDPCLQNYVTNHTSVREGIYGPYRVLIDPSAQPIKTSLLGGGGASGDSFVASISYSFNVPQLGGELSGSVFEEWVRSDPRFAELKDVSLYARSGYQTCPLGGHVIHVELRARCLKDIKAMNACITTYLLNLCMEDDCLREVNTGVGVVMMRVDQVDDRYVRLNTEPTEDQRPVLLPPRNLYNVEVLPYIVATLRRVLDAALIEGYSAGFAAHRAVTNEDPSDVSRAHDAARLEARRFVHAQSAMTIADEADRQYQVYIQGVQEQQAAEAAEVLPEQAVSDDQVVPVVPSEDEDEDDVVHESSEDEDVVIPESSEDDSDEAFEDEEDAEVARTTNALYDAKHAAVSAWLDMLDADEAEKRALQCSRRALVRQATLKVAKLKATLEAAHDRVASLKPSYSLMISSDVASKEAYLKAEEEVDDISILLREATLAEEAAKAKVGTVPCARRARRASF